MLLVNYQGASSPDLCSVYVDLRALRNDRVTLVEKGSPQSLCLMESGKVPCFSVIIIVIIGVKPGTGQINQSYM